MKRCDHEAVQEAIGGEPGMPAPSEKTNVCSFNANETQTSNAIKISYANAEIRKSRCHV